MAHSGFVPLRIFSSYTMLDGAIDPKAIAKRAAKLGFPAAGLTDRNGLYAAMAFSDAAMGAGVQPVIGTMLGVARPDLPEGVAPQVDWIALYAQDATGYDNLCALVSRAHLDRPIELAPHVAFDVLAAHATGLIALTAAGEGGVARLFAEGQPDRARAYADGLAAAFGDRLYIELSRRDDAIEMAAEAELVDLAYDRGWPLVATNPCCFEESDFGSAHDAMLCIAHSTYVESDDRPKSCGHAWMKPADAMKALFADLPEAIDNTLVVAQRCAVAAPKRKPILPSLAGDREGEAAMLREEARKGLDARLKRIAELEGKPYPVRAEPVEARDFIDVAGNNTSFDKLRTNGGDEQSPVSGEVEEADWTRSYRDRLEFELDVIIQMGFPGYFLIVADFIQWAKSHDIPVGPGRGSGAGSVVAWALTITDLDPLQLGLLFERFLNPERVSMPDFDIDFCQDRRDEVIHYVQDRYGRDRVAQIITFGKLQARAVLRDVGRVLEMPYGQVDKLCKMVPHDPAKPVTLDQAVAKEPLLQNAIDEDPAVERLFAIARQLEGLYRHASTHAGGVVIGDRPLDELIPLYRDPRSDRLVTGFNMKYVEEAGLIKFDFLGLKTLTVLADAAKLAEASSGTRIDLANLPLDDEATFAMLARADTTGVFQLESAGMRDVLRNLKADSFEDIIAVVALYRPGPMGNIPSYIRRKHGQEKPDYLYPTLEGILKETFGIIIYQEQVMQIAQELAGFSLGHADLIRRAMGKKIKSEMDKQRTAFVEGARNRNVPEARARDIFDLVAKFADYGFNKSHAATYALVAYQTAYLKAHHPVEFLAASMTHDMTNTDKLNVFRQEVDRMGIRLLPPDANASEARFSVDRDADGNPAIRYALAAVRNVGAAAMDALVAERRANGPFRDLADFARRLDPKVANKRALENLARAGAFDALNPNRRQVFEGVEEILRHAHAAHEERASSQISLFGGSGGDTQAKVVLPDVPDWPPMDRLGHEFEAIGFYLSAHPLDAYRRTLARLSVRPIAEVGADPEPGPVRLAGTVIGKKERTSAKGNRYAFVQFSDMTGVFEAIVFAETLAASRGLLEVGRSLLVRAAVQVEGESFRLTVQGLESLEEVAARTAAGIRIVVAAPDAVGRIGEIIAGGRGGNGNGNGRKGRVKLVSRLDTGHEVEFDLGEYRLNPAALAAVRNIAGVLEASEI
jgi:DNA polymerase-3 subunit alpha